MTQYHVQLRIKNIFSARKGRNWCQWDIKWAWINQREEFIWFENGFGKFFRNRKNVQKCPAKSLENDSTKIRARQFSLQLLTSTPVTLSSINLHVNIGIRRPSKCILCYLPNSIFWTIICYIEKHVQTTHLYGENDRKDVRVSPVLIDCIDLRVCRLRASLFIDL